MMSHEREATMSRRRLLEAAAGLGFVAIITGCGILTDKSDSAPTPSVSPDHEANHEIGIIGNGTWKYMPGAKKEGNSLTIEHTGLAVRTLEETWVDPNLPEYIANPPQNTYGTYLDITNPNDSIGFKAKLSDIQGRATLSFESKPTYRYDERTYRHTGVDVQIDGTNLLLKYWQEGQTTPTLTQVIPFDNQLTNAEFTLTQTERGVTVTIGGKSAIIPIAKVFPTGEVWFGMDASKSWKLDSLDAYPIGDAKIQPVDTSKFNYGNLSPAGLQAAVLKKRPDLVVGTAVDSTSLFTDPYYAKLVTENFGGLSTEMLAKPQALQPEEGHFVWNEYDALIDFAKRHNKQVHLHTLLFSEANPKWLEDKLKTASADEALALMKQVIVPTVSRHKDDVRTIDVINEPFDPDNWAVLRQNLWMKPLGAAYMDDGFKIAHAAAPDALLGINENALEADDDRWNAMLELVKGMKERKVPIDYVGFQMHFDEETLADEGVVDAILNGSQIEKRFKQLEELGLKVRVSEISVAEVDKNLQAHVYAAALKACLHAANCIGFTMWGAASNATYFTTEPDDATGLISPDQFGNDAPWQQNKNGTYSEKPAVAAMKKVIQ